MSRKNASRFNLWAPCSNILSDTILVMFSVDIDGIQRGVGEVLSRLNAGLSDFDDIWNILSPFNKHPFGLHEHLVMFRDSACGWDFVIIAVHAVNRIHELRE